MRLIYSPSLVPATRVIRMIIMAAAVALVGLSQVGREASAHHDVHYNYWYWEEWSYSPLAPVNAYDCIWQNNALQSAATEWSVTGYVSVTTQLDNCDLNPNGIRWRAGNSGCYGLVTHSVIEAKSTYLDPDSWSPPTNRALKIDIYIGTSCADGESQCASWYTPCDVLTHELGHGLGLADHYYNDCSSCAPAFDVFSYPNTPVGGTPVAVTPTVMDYPHRTDIQSHDGDDLNTLYRRAPFSPWNVVAASTNFHRINLTWTERSHNESFFYLDQSYDGGAYSWVGTPGRDATATTRDVYKPGRQYCYRLSGENSWGLRGANSNVGCTTPPNSVGSAIVGSFPSGSTSIGLCWDPAPSGAGVTGYYVLRRRNNGNGTYTNTLYLESTATDCYGNGKVAWVGTVSSATYKYHWAVKGCDGSWGCSDYKDMNSPNYQWVQLPWTGSGNSGTPSTTYHTH